MLISVDVQKVQRLNYLQRVFIKREGWCMANVAFTLLHYQAKQFSSRFLFHWLCSVYMSACVIGRVLRENKNAKTGLNPGKNRNT